MWKDKGGEGFLRFGAADRGGEGADQADADLQDRERAFGIFAQSVQRLGGLTTALEHFAHLRPGDRDKGNFGRRQQGVQAQTYEDEEPFH